MAKLRAFFKSKIIEVGCDEAGRGCLAGPVFAAAVILPPRWNHKLLNDSKLIPEDDRWIIQEAIERDVEHYAVASVSPAEIDEINILNASFLAMHRALDQLKIRPEHIIVDGNRFNPYRDITHTCIIKGDGKFRSIAAASILAKTHRDRYMMKLHEEFPGYGWLTNKGYSTREHRAAIEEIGSCEHHRRSFTLLPRQLELI